MNGRFNQDIHLSQRFTSTYGSKTLQQFLQRAMVVSGNESKRVLIEVGCAVNVFVFYVFFTESVVFPPFNLTGTTTRQVVSRIENSLLLTFLLPLIFPSVRMF